jgi:hypothetical protein
MNKMKKLLYMYMYICMCMYVYMYIHIYTQTHIIEYYQFMKKNEIMSFEGKWMELDIF